MKRKRLKRAEVQRRTRGLALVAAGMAAVYLAVFVLGANATPTFVVVALMLTQLFILMGSLVSLRWLRWGAFITLFSALAVGYMFTAALGAYVSLGMALLGAAIYCAPHVTLGLAQWDLANRAGSPPREDNPDSDRLALHDAASVQDDAVDDHAALRDQRAWLAVAGLTL